jgi:DNA-binding MarR family transcriptional regulator
MDDVSTTPAERLLLDDQLCFALYAATAAITRRYRVPLAEVGLTYPQYLVMLALWQDGPSTVGAVAQRLRLDSHGVSPIVARLEHAGLVVRRRGFDRRTVLVEASGRGLALEQQAARVQADVACATGLAPADLAALRHKLLTLTDELATAPLHVSRPTPEQPATPTHEEHHDRHRDARGERALRGR